MSGEITFTYSTVSGERLRTVMPESLTSWGRRFSAADTRFWTCIWAMSGSVPVSKVTFILTEPSAPHWLCMYIMRSTPFRASSIGAATVFISTSGEAPAYRALMETVGGTMEGY